MSHAEGQVRATARVRLAPHLSREVFEAHLRAIAAVRSAVYVIGDVDYELRLACRDLADLGVVLASLRPAWPAWPLACGRTPRGWKPTATSRSAGGCAAAGRYAARGPPGRARYRRL